MTTEEKVFEMLMSSDFELWYESEFMDFAEGEKGAPSKERILEFIRSYVK